MGDFNYDLLKQLESAIENFEEVFLSQGFFPLISLATHSSSATQSSCIDNIFTNDIDKISLSGVIKDMGKHHSPVFPLMNFNLDKASCKSRTQIQEYSYSSKNIDSIIDAVEHKYELFLAWHKSNKIEKDPGDKNLHLKFNKCRYCLNKIIKE